MEYMFDSKIVLKVLNSYETKLIMQSIEEFDGETRFVGGCVRDLILKRPIYDIDLATTLLPNQIINALSFHNIKTVVTNIKYGTIVAVLKDQTFEITTLRRDTKCYGREAEVEFTNE